MRGHPPFLPFVVGFGSDDQQRPAELGQSFRAAYPCAVLDAQAAAPFCCYIKSYRSILEVLHPRNLVDCVVGFRSSFVNFLGRHIYTPGNVARHQSYLNGTTFHSRNECRKPDSTFVARYYSTHAIPCVFRQPLTKNTNPQVSLAPVTTLPRAQLAGRSIHGRFSPESPWGGRLLFSIRCAS